MQLSKKVACGLADSQNNITLFGCFD